MNNLMKRVIVLFCALSLTKLSFAGVELQVIQVLNEDSSSPTYLSIGLGLPLLMIHAPRVHHVVHEYHNNDHGFRGDHHHDDDGDRCKNRGRSSGHHGRGRRIKKH